MVEDKEFSAEEAEEPQRAHFPDYTYTEHPQHQPRIHKPIPTASALVAVALEEMKKAGAKDDVMEELKQIGVRYGSMPLSTHENQFLAELLMFLVMR